MFWSTFDYNNKFSDINEESPFLIYGYLNYKLFYFQKQQEFIFASRIEDCNIFIMIFNKNLQLTFKGIQYNNECTYSTSFAVVFIETDYTLIMDKGYESLFYKNLNNNDSEVLFTQDIDIQTNPEIILTTVLSTIPTVIPSITFLKTNPTTI